MALAIDKDGKVFNKHLTLSELEIREAMDKCDKKKHRKIILRASKVEINRRIAS